MAAEYNPRLDPEALLSPQETSELTGDSTHKLAKDRRLGRGIPYIRTSYNRVKYRRQDIVDYIAAQRVVPGAPTPEHLRHPLAWRRGRPVGAPAPGAEK